MDQLGMGLLAVEAMSFAVFVITFIIALAKRGSLRKFSSAGTDSSTTDNAYATDGNGVVPPIVVSGTVSGPDAIIGAVPLQPYATSM